MFRIQTNAKANNTNLLRKGNARGFDDIMQLLGNRYFTHSLLIIVLLIIGYGIWTHGTFTLKGRDEAKLAAQAQSPLPPEWLERYFKRDVCNRPAYCGPDADPDKDGMTNYEEFLFFTDPTDPDSDKDGVNDGVEVKRNFTNPLGSGPTPRPRDITEISEFNPFADDIIAEGLEAIQRGEILTLEQINQEASSIEPEQLPQFNDVPFSVVNDNSPESVRRYLDVFVQITETYRNNESTRIGPEIVDSTDVELLEKYSEATQVYAVSMVAMETPSAVFAFHKAFFGSLVFRGLMINAQLDFLRRHIGESELREKAVNYTIYHTRFLQDASQAADEIQQQYEFPFTFSET